VGLAQIDAYYTQITFLKSLSLLIFPFDIEEWRQQQHAEQKVLSVLMPVSFFKMLS